MFALSIVLSVLGPSATAGPLAHQADQLLEARYRGEDAAAMARFEADLDGDGELEKITVSWTEEVEVLLTVREPAVEGPGAEQTLLLGQAHDIDGPLELVSTRATTAAETGIPLVFVNWAAQEQCGSGDWSRYASYQSEGPGKAGVLKQALVHPGSGSDSPVFWETAVSWTPEARSVSVHKRSGEYGDSGHPDLILEDKTTRYVLRDGVFVEDPPKSGNGEPAGP